MALEQCFQGSTISNEITREKDSSLGKWTLSDMVENRNDNSPSGFDCNICFDFVQDPVVTFCGHLYCWPCIYKWLHMESISADISNEQPPQCPVCKAELSEATLVPLYGRDNMEDNSENKVLHRDPCIPRRPPAPTFGRLLPDSVSTHLLRSELLPFGHFQSITPPYFSHHNSSILRHPFIFMVSEMIHGRGFSSSATNMYNSSNSYYSAEDLNPRVRRHVAETDKSLSKISSFLLCCIMLCLIFF
ncbi:hypothetical protein QQ045_001707 [Rhodiola kirilowii]